MLRSKPAKGSSNAFYGAEPRNGGRFAGAARHGRPGGPPRGKKTQGKTSPDAHEPLERRPNAPRAAGLANRVTLHVSVGPVDRPA